MKIVERLIEVVKSRHWDVRVGHVYTWVLLEWSWLRIVINVQTHSEDPITFRASKNPMLWWVFKGVMHLHRGADTHKTKFAESYVYSDGDGAHRLEMLYAPVIARLDRYELYYVELLPARTYEERTFDMVRWMTISQYDRNTERQAWWLSAEVGRR